MKALSVAIIAFIALTAECADAKDLSAMGGEEVTALQRRQRRGRACLSNGVGAALMLAAGRAESAATAADLQTMSAPDIYALQRRLTDVGCYTGPLDGKASPA